MENEELKKAIEVVENAGGFVMMQGDLEEEIAPMSDARLKELEAREQESINDYNERKEECFEDFQKMLGRKDFSIAKVDDLLFKHGLDLDDLEDFIHRY